MGWQLLTVALCQVLLLSSSAEWLSFCDLGLPFMEHCACVQVILFVDENTVSKGMVKYATAIPRESIVDVSGEVHVPETPVAGCTCSKASLVDPLLESERHLTYTVHQESLCQRGRTSALP